MANIDISNLPVASGLGGTEDVPIVQGGTTKRTSTQAIADLALTPSGVSAGTYGNATNVAQITVDTNGFVTNAVNVPITAGAGTVTSVSVVSANGLAGAVANPTSTPALTLSTTVTGLVKGDGTALSAATAGVDYSAGTSTLATGILKSNTSSGSLSIATAGTDYQAPITLTTTGTSGAATFVGDTLNIPVYAAPTGTVTDVSVVSANGFAGTVANPSTTPAITLSTSVTGILQGDGTAISAASTTGTGAVVLASNPVLTNPTANNFISLISSTVASGTTTVLTNTSYRQQILTGSSTQTFQLPDATTLTAGENFVFNNNSSGVLTVVNNGGTTIVTVPAGGKVEVDLLTNATTNGTWDGHPSAPLTAQWGSGTTGLIMNSVLSTTPAISAGASGSTTPAFIPQRGTTNTGIGGDSTHVYGIVGGVNQLAISSAGLTVPALTASSAVATDASKNLVSVANTGTGSNVLAVSPALTGTPTAPTATVGTNTTQIATTAFVLANSSTGAVIGVANRTALAALATSVGVAFVEGATGGIFEWNASNLSAAVTADPLQGVYVPPPSDMTGASGAWVRVYAEALRPEWFGAAPDGATNCGPGLRACGSLISFFGKGLMQLSAGTYLVSTLGPNSQMLTPYANMSIQGIGAESIIKLANGVSTTSFFGIYNGVGTSASTDCSNFSVRNLAIDYNGQNNLVSGYAAGIYVGVGDDVVMDGVATKNFPGSQPMVIGATYASDGTTLLTTPAVNRPIIRNCVFRDVGNTVNSAATDSSDIYVVCTDGIIMGNAFYNSTQDDYGTAIEVHGTGTTIGNVIDKVSKAYNFGAYPDTNWTVAGNKITSFHDYATMWNTLGGSNPAFGLSVTITGDHARTGLLPTGGNAAAVNAASNLSASGFVSSIKIRGCHFECTGGGGVASTAPFMTVGHSHLFDFSGNYVFGWPGEVMLANGISGGQTVIQFNENHILNCCGTSTAGHTVAVLIDDATNKVAGFQGNSNAFFSDGGTYMTKAFQGTALPASPAPVLSGNLLINVATLGP